jgi:hypothetical protein
MQNASQLAHAHFGTHDDGDFVDHLTRARCDDRGANDLIRPLANMNLGESIVPAVGDGTVDILHHYDATRRPGTRGICDQTIAGVNILEKIIARAAL